MPTDRDSKPVVTTPLLAGGRDASCYAAPDVHSVKVFHIATNINTAGCRPGPLWRSGVIVLVEFTYVKAEEIYDDLRCRRAGCKTHWDTVPAKPRLRGREESVA